MWLDDIEIWTNLDSYEAVKRTAVSGSKNRNPRNPPKFTKSYVYY